MEELPPHTRRRALVNMGISRIIGTTSAYAEKRCEINTCVFHKRNYLRIRGEEGLHMIGDHSGMELPPHTRRRAWSR